MTNINTLCPTLRELTGTRMGEREASDYYSTKVRIPAPVFLYH